MSTEVRTDAQADLDAVIKAITEKRAIDPAITRRGRERSRQAREALLRQYGERDIAVELIREAREE
jgi:hypothetical protein